MIKILKNKITINVRDKKNKNKKSSNYILTNFINFILICFLVFCSSSDSFSSTKRMRCSLNSDCRPGFVCVGGVGGDFGTGLSPKGCCEVILPIRQVCFAHQILTGSFGRGVAAMVIITIALSGIVGKLNWKSLITFFVGITCIFGSYQVVKLLTGFNYMMCDLIDTTTAPGKCADYYDDDDISNAYVD